MVSATITMVAIGGLLAAAALIAPLDAGPRQRTRVRRAGRPAQGPRRWRLLPRPRSGRNYGASAAAGGVLADARLAERAAALLRSGVEPSTAWRYASACDVLRPPASEDEVDPLTALPASVRAVWRLAERTGAPPADALEACAAGLREEADAQAAVRVAMAGAEVSARTVSLLPVLGLALGAALGAPPWQALAGSVVGRLCGILGVALLLAGRWWSRRLLRQALAVGG